METGAWPTKSTPTNNHTSSMLSLHTRGNLKRPINLQTCKSLWCGRKPEHPEETHTVTERMCNLYTDSTRGQYWNRVSRTRENPCGHRENMETPHRQHQRSRLNLGVWRCEATGLPATLLCTLRRRSMFLSRLTQDFLMFDSISHLGYSCPTCCWTLGFSGWVGKSGDWGSSQSSDIQ